MTLMMQPVRNASILLKECQRRRSRKLTTCTKKRKGGVTVEKVAILAVIILLLSGCATGTINSQMQREEAKEQGILEATLQELEKESEPKKERAEISVGVGLFTKHFQTGSSTNENNRAVILSYDDWCTAWFENSYHRESIFAGRIFRTEKLTSKEYNKWFIRGNLYLGLVYGYKDELPNIRGISPYMLPTGEVGYGKFSFELGIIPAPGHAGLVTGMFKFTF
jgi:hypothetical protein